MEEIEWKDIDGFNGYYQVSNSGLIRNITSSLVAQRVENRYVRVKLYKDGEQFTKRVNRLVAIAFVPNPLNLPEVNHLDFNKLNNHYTNLEWSTQEDNFNHAFENGRIKKHEEHGRAKLNWEKVKEIRKDDRGNYEIARDYGVSGNAIRKVKLGLTWVEV